MEPTPQSAPIRIVLQGKAAPAMRWLLRASPDSTRQSRRQYIDRALYWLCLALLWRSATWLVGRTEPWQANALPWLAASGCVICLWLTTTGHLARLRVPTAVVGFLHGAIAIHLVGS
jgi:hypothetical protein